MARNKKGAPPSYRLHKPTGQAVVTIMGRDIYLGEFGSPSSLRQYGLLLAGDAEAKPKGEQLDATSVPALVEVLAAYWKFAKTYYVKNGKPTNELDAMRLVIRDAKLLFGTLPVSEFGPKKLKAVRQIWIDRGQARPTVNKNMRRLTRIFRWAAAEEMAAGELYQALTAVPGLKKGRCDLPEPDPIVPVPLDVVERTLSQLTPVTRDMVQFQLLTGARPGEVCQMRPMDIDRSDDVWRYQVASHKTQHHGRNRTIYIGPEAQKILRPYLLRSNDRVCFSMAESLEQRRAERAARRKTPPSCGNARGRRSNADLANKTDRKLRAFQDAFDASSYRNAIHAACNWAFPAPEPLGCREGETIAARMRRLSSDQLAELKKWQQDCQWHPNQLRHTKATEIRKKFGLEAAQLILGHAAADVTQVYAERDEEKARDVALRIG